MLMSQRVRPDRVRPAIFPYHFTHGFLRGLKRLRALPLDQAPIVAIEALPFNQATVVAFEALLLD